MRELRKKLPALRKIFRKNKIVLAYLFGSVATEKEGKLSDIDFAVLLDEEVAVAKYFDIRLKLISQLGELIRDLPVDVIVLNEVPPILAQMALTRGKLLFCQDEDLKARFSLRTCQVAEEMRFLRETFYKYLEKRVRLNKLGERLYA